LEFAPVEAIADLEVFTGTPGIDIPVEEQTAVNNCVDF
jgi:hypothetical protein